MGAKLMDFREPLVGFEPTTTYVKHRPEATENPSVDRVTGFRIRGEPVQISLIPKTIVPQPYSLGGGASA